MLLRFAPQLNRYHDFYSYCQSLNQIRHQAKFHAVTFAWAFELMVEEDPRIKFLNPHGYLKSRVDCRRLKMQGFQITAEFRDFDRTKIRYPQLKVIQSFFLPRIDYFYKQP